VVHSRRQQGRREDRLRVFTRTSYKHRRRTDADLTITDSMSPLRLLSHEHDESSPRSHVMSPGSVDEQLELHQESTDLPVADSIQGLACAALGSLSPISYTMRQDLPTADGQNLCYQGVFYSTEKRQSRHRPGFGTTLLRQIGWRGVLVCSLA